MTSIEDVVQKIDTLNNNIQQNYTWSPDGYIKVFDHMLEKISKILPDPVFAKKSRDFAKKTAFGTSIGIFVIGVIIIISIWFKTKDETEKTSARTKTFDKQGNITSDNTDKINYTDKEGCSNTYDNDGILIKQVCLKNKKSKTWMILVIVAILSVVAYFLTYKPVFKWHFAKAIRHSNPYHKTFIDYFHRLLDLPWLYSDSTVY